jgi:hypothetical protein
MKITSLEDKLNRKTSKKNNKMLENHYDINKNTIETLKKKFGFTNKQIVQEFKISDDFEKQIVDIAIFPDEGGKPKIIGEIKVGNFIFPFAKNQLKKYMQMTNVKYSFLTNGKEWINYELIDKELITIPSIPISKELTNIHNDIKKEFEQISGAEHSIRNMFKSMRVYGHINTENILQLISLKLYDEKYENNENFKQISKLHNESSKNYHNVLEKLFTKVDKKFPNIHSNFELTLEKTSEFLPLIIELSNFSLTKSEPIKIARIILEESYTHSNLRFRWNSPPKELIKFIHNLFNLNKKSEIFLPYSEPAFVLDLLELLNLDHPENSNENITIMDPRIKYNQIYQIFSQLSLPKFEKLSEEPVFSSNFKKFTTCDNVISCPPFGMMLNETQKWGTSKNTIIPKSKKIKKSDEIDLTEYGNESIHYFISKLIINCKEGTKIALVVPQGFLFKSNRHYEKIREEIISRCTIQGIIQLPGNYFENTAISTALLILEIGTPKQDTYNIFMSVFPKPKKLFEHSNVEILKKIIQNFHNVEKGISINGSEQYGFTVPIQEIIHNNWTVTNKTPEFEQMLNIEYKQTISEIVEIIQPTGIPLGVKTTGKNTPLIRISDIENNSIKSKIGRSITIENNSIDKFKKFFIKEGDILLSHRGTIGKTVIVKKKNEGSVASNQILILRCKKGIIPEYLFNYLNSKIFKKQIKSGSGGVLIPFLSIPQFRKCVISVPPISIQKEKISKTMKLESEISDIETILSEKKRKLQEIRDNE